MPLYRRIARRGFSNYRFKTVYVPVNLDLLSSAFEKGGEITLEVLKERGLVSRNAEYVKVLGRGECTAKFVVKGLAVSAGARAKIEAAGGSVDEPATTTEEGSEEG